MNKSAQDEQIRIQELEALRNKVDANVIDAAIRDGRTAGQVAHETLLNRAKEKETVQAIADAMDACHNLERAAASTGTGNADADMIAAAMNKNRRGVLQ